MKNNLKILLCASMVFTSVSTFSVNAFNQAHLDKAMALSEKNKRGELATPEELNLNGFDLSLADLSHANLTRTDLTGAYMHGTDLSGADLTGTNLSWSNLTDSDLTRADLSHANLTEAYLLGANLTGTDLTGAYLYGARLPRTKVAGATKLLNAAQKAHLKAHKVHNE